MFQDMNEELGIEGEVGADTDTREMKMVMMIKDMSMIQSTMTKQSKGRDLQCQRQNGANGNNDDHDESY